MGEGGLAKMSRDKFLCFWKPLFACFDLLWKAKAILKKVKSASSHNGGGGGRNDTKCHTAGGGAGGGGP
jgi:hypothetical protein